MKEALSVAEFESHYGVGHTKTAEIIKTGELETYRVGRRRFVSRRAAEDWQRGLEAAQKAQTDEQAVA